jgi:hypothetical protein
MQHRFMGEFYACLVSVFNHLSIIKTLRTKLGMQYIGLKPGSIQNDHTTGYRYISPTVCLPNCIVNQALKIIVEPGQEVGHSEQQIHRVGQQREVQNALDGP